MKIFGVDFSSSPNKKKPIIVAKGFIEKKNYLKTEKKFLIIEDFYYLHSLSEFEFFLKSSGPWFAGFDLPFSMPVELVEFYKWPKIWNEFVDFYCSQSREYLRSAFVNWCNQRQVGNKFAWRKTDKCAGSSPSMRWTNPPVAWMMHVGMKIMIKENLYFPAHNFPTESNKVATQFEKFIDKKITNFIYKVAFESYPGFTVRKILKKSYKSDDLKKNTQERYENRVKIMNTLTQPHFKSDLSLICSKNSFNLAIDDPKGDFLDSMICAFQVADSLFKKNFGLTHSYSSFEGWITSVPNEEKKKFKR